MHNGRSWKSRWLGPPTMASRRYGTAAHIAHTVSRQDVMVAVRKLACRSLAAGERVGRPESRRAGQQTDVSMNSRRVR